MFETSECFYRPTQTIFITINLNHFSRVAYHWLVPPASEGFGKGVFIISSDTEIRQRRVIEQKKVYSFCCLNCGKAKHDGSFQCVAAPQKENPAPKVNLPDIKIYNTLGLPPFTPHHRAQQPVNECLKLETLFSKIVSNYYPKNVETRYL